MRQRVYVKFAEALQARAMERQAYDVADAIMAKIAEAGMEKDAGLKEQARAILAAGLLALSPAAKVAPQAVGALPASAPVIERFMDVAKAAPAAFKAAPQAAKAVVKAVDPVKDEIAAVARHTAVGPVWSSFGNGPIPPGKRDWKRILKWLGVGTAATGAAGLGGYAYGRRDK